MFFKAVDLYIDGDGELLDWEVHEKRVIILKITKSLFKKEKVCKIKRTSIKK